MSIGKSAACAVLLLALLGDVGGGRRMAAQGGGGGAVPGEETTPLTISGFAVGSAGYDKNLAQSSAVASKLALSLFRPWSDQLYLFGQLTTHLEAADSGPPATAIEIDNLIISWTPARVTAPRGAPAQMPFVCDQARSPIMVVLLVPSRMSAMRVLLLR